MNSTTVLLIPGPVSMMRMHKRNLGGKQEVDDIG